MDNAGKLEGPAINELRLKTLAAGYGNRTRVLNLGSGCFARALITKHLKKLKFRVLKLDEITTVFHGHYYFSQTSRIVGSIYES